MNRRTRLATLILTTISLTHAVVGDLIAQKDLVAASDAIRVTGGDIWFMQPRWTPDGTALAFTGANYHGIWVAETDGSNLKPIIEEPAAGFGFSWSTDGGTILTRVARFQGLKRLNAIRVIDVASGVSQTVLDYTTQPVSIPEWLDNEVQVSATVAGAISVFEVAGRTPKTTLPPQPRVMAHGEKIVRVSFFREPEVVTVAEEQRSVLNLVRSPDGTRLAFEILGGGLAVMDAGGGNRIDLGEGNRPQWSPDGQWIVYQRTEDDGHEFTASDLYAVRSDGSTLVRLTETGQALEMNPAWSPDGRYIAFDDRGSIFLLPVAEE